MTNPLYPNIEVVVTNSLHDPNAVTKQVTEAMRQAFVPKRVVDEFLSNISIGGSQEFLVRIARWYVSVEIADR